MFVYISNPRTSLSVASSVTIAQALLAGGMSKIYIVPSPILKFMISAGFWCYQFQPLQITRCCLPFIDALARLFPARLAFECLKFQHRSDRQTSSGRSRTTSTAQNGRRALIVLVFLTPLKNGRRTLIILEYRLYFPLEFWSIHLRRDYCASRPRIMLSTASNNASNIVANGSREVLLILLRFGLKYCLDYRRDWASNNVSNIVVIGP